MKELDFLKIISSQLSFSNYLGDDCAYLDELDIFVTQDTLVEDVHFTMYTITAYLLGRKAVSVNLSDLAAALSVPKYITVSLSLPKNISEDFVSELYRGINDICDEYKVKVIGGDITGSDKIVISVCAIGKKISLYNSSRKYAKKGDYIVVTGNFGSSAAGLYSLQNFLQVEDVLKNAHINPIPKVFEAEKLATIIDSNIAVIDSSDGLIDALYRISQDSKHSLEIDFDNVPILQETIAFSKRNELDYSEFVKWGGEDFELVACVPEQIYHKLDKNIFKHIGFVQNKDFNPCVQVNFSSHTERITREIFEKKSYNHFKEV